MNNLNPKVSIVMSVYNGLPYLQESIDSILAQTFTDFEFIIIDDCSNDDTGKILKQYAQKDERIVLIQNPENLGLTKSLNKGINLAQGEYIARQDADDISLPKRLEKQVNVLKQNLEVVLVSCDIELINAEGFPVGKFYRACEPDLVAWYLIFYNRLAGHSQTMFRRESVIKLGGYNESYRYGQDYELWCRLVKTGKFHILATVLLQQRLHNKRISHSKSTEQNSYALNQVRCNIKQLIGEEISAKEAQDIMGFWIGHWWPQYFPDSDRASLINWRMRQICQQFARQQNQKDFSQSQIISRLHNLIGKQFLYWIQAPLSKKHTVIAKLEISRYALIWSPLGLPGSWLIGFWNSLRHTLRIFIQQYLLPAKTLL